MTPLQRLRLGALLGLGLLLNAFPATAEPRAAAPARPARAEQPGPSAAAPKAAGTQGTAKSAASKPVKEQETAEGVKTYEFGAVEVEGRLRSPQILYFLRRVRAEFDADPLGHRSFLRELADTRNDPSFR